MNSPEEDNFTRVIDTAQGRQLESSVNLETEIHVIINGLCLAK